MLRNTSLALAAVAAGAPFCLAAESDQAQGAQPKTMHAVRMHDYGGPEVLVYEEIPRPVPEAGQVLVQVYVASLNAGGWKVREGRFRRGDEPLGEPYILGWDISGVVAEVGEGVEGFEIGQPVYGFLDYNRGGAYAEYAIATTDEILPKPDGLSHEQAGSLALAGITALQALNACAVGAGDTVLIQAGAGGVGHIAVQLAHARGVIVATTASAGNHDFLRSLGADTVIDYRSQNFEDVVSGVDACIDGVGGDVRERCYGVVRPGGVLVSLTGGLEDAKLKEHGITGYNFGARRNTADLQKLADLILAGDLEVVVSKTFPLERAAEASAYSQAGHLRGKIALVTPAYEALNDD